MISFDRRSCAFLQPCAGSVNAKPNTTFNLLTHPAPLLNSSSKWATTFEELEALYTSPFTGAVTVRTSTLNGFAHDEAVHQHCFFDPKSMALLASPSPSTPSQSTSPSSAVSSLNTLGYAPKPFAHYLDLMSTIERKHTTSTPSLRSKPIIYSVGGSIPGILQCAELLASHQHRCPPLLEINLSCPNIPSHPPPAYSARELDALLTALGSARATASFAWGLKLPPYTHAAQFADLIGALRAAAARDSRGVCPVAYLASTNTLGSCLALDSGSGGDAFGPALSSVDGTGVGGLAGAALHPLALGNVSSLRRALDREDAALRDVLVIGIGGVADAAGFERMRSVGAGAVGVATALGKDGVGVFERILNEKGV